MLRHIAWFNEALVEPCPEGGLKSADPAVHRRCLMPARELEELGVECSVFGNLSDADPIQVGRHLQKLETDIVVIGKISEPSRLNLARMAKHLGCYVIADLGIEMDTAGLARLAEIADQVVASSSEVAAEIRKQTGITALVIPDCEDSPGVAEASATAHLWLDCFRQLKLKPPASANMNMPGKA